jgi:mono/diheme cytochrome c family protein/cytochrome c551/c552
MKVPIHGAGALMTAFQRLRGAGIAIFIPIALLGTRVASGRGGDAPAKPSADAVNFFESKVRPLLIDRCIACHGPDKRKAGLRLDSDESMRKGGESGAIVTPGNPDQSLLIEAIRYTGDVQMPPKKKLDDKEIDVLVEWVRRGAQWPEPTEKSRSVESKSVADSRSSGETIDTARREFWSFQPIVDTAPPSVDSTTAIDGFIDAELEKNGLKPAPAADKRTLIRRATFDLIGLPPTPDEVDAFIKDESPDAFAKVIDRLLASPQYGVRWARHWLDVARYGEDQAHSFQPRLYPNGFRYRDWVASALNSDMPYDQFLMNQIAGDLLDDPGKPDRLAALGFFAVGPVYYGDPKKLDQIDDRIDALTRGVLGLTVACARCHDHKFDPIPTTDYYALAGVFAGTEYDEVPLVSAEEVKAYDRAQEVVKAKEGEVETFLKAEAERIVGERVNSIARYVVAVWNSGAFSVGKADEIARSEGLDAALLKRWITFLKPKEGESDSWRASWRVLVDRRGYASENGEGKAEAVYLANDLQSRVSRAFAARNSAKATAEEKRFAESEKALVEALTGNNGVLSITNKQVEERPEVKTKEKLTALRNEVERLRKAAPAKYPTVHSLKDGPKPVDMNVLIRGDSKKLGPIVPRRFLSVSGGETAPFRVGSGRLELAKAIVDRSNPLTARVFVNRVWAHHFGRGIAGTPSNFGALGERPTHPALLDHLASRFISGGWSIKSLHRAIMLTNAYRRSGRFDARAHEVDPENRLLWRMSRRRLEVEPWRDAILAATGELDLTIGGPSFSLDDASAKRRTFYAKISRHDLAPLLRSFDFPDPNITCSERTRTTTPLQQLFVLNDEFMMKSAAALVARLEREASADDASFVRRAYPLLFARPASDAEIRVAIEYLSRDDREKSPPGAPSRRERYAHSLLSSNEFIFID